MEPAFQRGDLLFLWNRSPTAELGEVVVYNVQGKDIPIVHRVVRTFPEVDSKTKRVKMGYVVVFAVVVGRVVLGGYVLMLILHV